MNNRLIIFSKNRAAQLHLLLESILKNANELFDDIIILYTASDEYVLGYEKLKSKFKSDVIVFYKERNFKIDLLNLLDDFYAYTTFMVDDLIVYDNIPLTKSEILNTITDDVLCFSLRLGYNCNYSHPANLHYSLGKHEIYEDYIKFNFREHTGDFNYPLSVDGHIFRTNQIQILLKDIQFRNPNTLESALQIFHGSSFIQHNITSFKTSKIVGVPVNLVNDTFNNRHGLEYYISEKELNDRYLSDEIIDLESLDFTNINGPHKEIKYGFKKS